MPYSLCWRNFANVLVLTLGILVFTSPSQSGTSSSRWRDLLETYVDRAFAYSSRTNLQKFETEGTLLVGIECLGSDSYNCAISLAAATNPILDTKNLKYEIHLNRDLIRALNIRFHIGSAPEIAARAKQILQESGEQALFDSSDQNCQLIYLLKGSTITRADILIATSQGRLRTEICAANQLNRALGISSPANLSFAELWNHEPNGLRFMNEEQYEQMRHTLATFQYLHMCNSLKPGSTLQEVQKLLNEDETCTDNLEGSR